MGIRYDPAESYETWLTKVRDYELKIAHQKLAQGIPLDQVMVEMSQRLSKKMLHPIMTIIKDHPNNYDPVESRQRYEETMKYVGPKPDHVDEKS
jgi:glutamyl-tRNA reductase